MTPPADAAARTPGPPRCGPAREVAVRAVLVDNPTGLYLAGRALIPTQDGRVR